MHKGYSVQHLIKHNKTNESYFWWRALTFIGLIVDSRRSQMHTDRGVRAPIIDFSSGYFFFVIFFWCCWKLWQVRNSSVTTLAERINPSEMNGELNLQGLVAELRKDLTSSCLGDQVWMPKDLRYPAEECHVMNQLQQKLIMIPRWKFPLH